MRIESSRIVDLFVWDSLRDTLRGLNSGAFIHITSAWAKISKYRQLELHLRSSHRATKITHINEGNHLLNGLLE